MAPIHEAARRGDLAEVRRLVEEDPSVIDQDDGSYWGLPLLWAASGGHVAVAAYLLDQGAAVNQRIRGALRTALYMACERGHGEVVRLLLARGADPTLSDGEGYTPLIIASLTGHVEVVRCLLSDGKSPINSYTHFGRTALWYAAWGGNAEVARLLLQAGADPTIPDEDGCTPLSLAREENHHDVVALLEVRIEVVVWTCRSRSLRFTLPELMASIHGSSPG